MRHTIPGLSILLAAAHASAAISFVSTEVIETSAAVADIVLAGLDGDEDLDLAFLGSMAPLTLLFNDGGASFGAPVPTDITVNLSFLNTIMDLGDLNGDLDADIACARFLSEEVRVALNSGDATFTDGDAVNVSFPTGIDAADLDGNGTNELVARSSAFIAILAGAGDGTFGTADMLEMPFGREIAVGDVDINDFLLLRAAFGPCPDPPAACPADLDEDGTVGVTDFLILLANFG